MTHPDPKPAWTLSSKARVERFPNSQDYCVAEPNDGPVHFVSASEWECDKWLMQARGETP